MDGSSQERHLPRERGALSTETVATTTLSDRAQAGRILAQRLRKYAGRDDVVVMALPRGGVPVGFELAQALRVPLDVFLVRKLGVPGHEELALGAIASGGTRVLNEQVVQGVGIPREWIEAIDAKDRRELERRERAYRADRPPPDLTDRVVILVDDGLATGSTMLAAVQAVREDDPEVVVLLERARRPALPGPPRPLHRLTGAADDYDSLLEMATKARFVLIGEAS